MGIWPALYRSQTVKHAQNIRSKLIEAGHYRPASETPFKWRFTGGLIVARYCMLSELSHTNNQIRI